jgi:membrane associated rhomboid family serine protease
MNFVLTPVVKNLLIINGLFFLLKMSVSPEIADLFVLHFWESSAMQPWQFITHMFMHANFVHIMSNMFGLFIFGPHLERFWGSQRFLFYYIVCGLGAALCQLLWYQYQFTELMAIIPDAEQMLQVIKQEGHALKFEGKEFADNNMNMLNSLVNNGMVGASGAIFGILLAFGMIFPNVELMLLFLPIPIKAKYFVVLYGLYELNQGLANNPGDNIAHYAHLGGMLFGIVMILYWRKFDKPTSGYYERWD